MEIKIRRGNKLGSTEISFTNKVVRFEFCYFSDKVLVFMKGENNTLNHEYELVWR